MLAFSAVAKAHHSAYGVSAAAARGSVRATRRISSTLLISSSTVPARPARGLRRPKNIQFHVAFRIRFKARLAASAFRGRPRARPSAWPAAHAMLTYNGVQTAPNAGGGGCQRGLARPRYQALSGSTASAPAAAAAPTATAVRA